MSSAAFMILKMEFDTPIHFDQQRRPALEKALKQGRLNSENWRKEIHKQRTARAIAIGLTSEEELE